MTGLWMHVMGLPWNRRPDAALVAADARPDILDPALASLVGEVWVGDHCPGHGYQVCLGFGDNPFALHGVGDPACD